MKKHFKGFFVGVIITSILMTNSLTMAQSMKKMIEVTFNSVNLKVNGQAVKADNILYNGTTYVPLRAIGEMLGKDIGWDGATNTASINDKINLETVPTGNIHKDNFVSFPYSFTQNNITIKLNKVIQDDDSLKLYLTYINNSENSVMTGDSLVKIVANGRQYSYDSSFNFDRYYKKPVDKADNFIEPGVTADSVVFFQPIKDVENINVVLSAQFMDFKFNNVKVQVETKNLSKVNTNSNKQESLNITNAQELKQYLQDNFSELDTVIGKTKFTFNILENDINIFPYDYWIQVKYEYEFFGGAIISTKYTNEQRQTLKNELKAHMENLGKNIIALMPDKKITGNYYDSWYKYPNLRVDLQTRRYYTWTNYNEPNILSNISSYEQTTPSKFRWYDFIDDVL